MNKKNAVISHSGGLDSTSLLLRLLADEYSVTAIGFDYGQKHLIEVNLARELCQFLSKKGFDIEFHLIKLDGLRHLLESNLLSGNMDVPKGHYEESSMKATVVPNRNKIFISIIQAVALSIANKTNDNVIISYGAHAGDHAIYPDCRQSFRDADYKAFIEGNWGSEKVIYYTPYLKFTKTEVLEDGLKQCLKLSLDYKDIYAKTMTSYQPLYINGCWYSDYQSSSSIERIEAFLELGIEDPLVYADKNGFRSWSEVKSHVVKTINTFKNR